MCQKNPSSNQPFRRQGKQILIENHLNGPHSSIQNLEDLIQFLQLNPNVHNDYVLSLINLGPRSFSKGQSSKHHIIPIHDGGSPEKWNILEVSKEEHKRIHTLRYEVYQQDGDRRAIYGTTNDAKMALSTEDISDTEDEMISSNVMDSSTENSSDTEEIQVENNLVKPKYFYRRTPETLKAIEQGMIWRHKEGFEVRIPPNTIETIEQIKQLLIDSLPEDHGSRERILKNKTSVNYIRKVINNVFGDQPNLSQSSVYGFSLNYYS